MRKEEKIQIIESLAVQLEITPNFYITNLEGMNAEVTSKFSRACFEKNIKLAVVKNTLLYKALEQKGFADLDQFATMLKGSTAIMFAPEAANVPGKLIQEFSKDAGKGKPELKGAYVQECVYVGAENLDTLANIKSREELIGDIITLLQSPAKNVISALTSQGGGKIAGIVKTLSEKE